MFSPTNPFRTIVRTPEAAAPAADAETTDSTTVTDAEKTEDAAAVVVTSSEEYLTEWWTTRVQEARCLSSGAQNYRPHLQGTTSRLGITFAS